MGSESEKGVSNGLTQRQLLEALGITSAGWGDARVWAAVYSHRRACVRYLRDAVLGLLQDPTLTRRRLRAELAQLAQQVEEWGPPDAEEAEAT